jgi:hypothetical protein
MFKSGKTISPLEVELNGSLWVGKESFEDSLIDTGKER